MRWRWPVFFQGLTVVVGLLALTSLFVPAPADATLRKIAGGLTIVVGLYNFWTKVWEKPREKR